MNKNEIIAKIYLDPAGFGSNAATQKYDKSITLQDIKDWKYKKYRKKN